MYKQTETNPQNIVLHRSYWIVYIGIAIDYYFGFYMINIYNKIKKNAILDWHV
jgi:hypothetical protein